LSYLKLPCQRFISDRIIIHHFTRTTIKQNAIAAAILIIKIGFLKGSLRLPFKKLILGVAAPTALQHSKLVSK